MLSKKLMLSAVVSGGLFLFAGAGGISVYGDAPQAQAAGHVPSQTLNVEVTKAKIQSIPNVVYAQVTARGYQNVALGMDILQPQKKGKMPAILFITGGGFINANKANDIQLRMHLAEAGYVVASATYRVAPTVVFPAPVEDMKAAIRFLKANADRFNIDPNRIGVVGQSAGGYLAAMVGTTNGSKTFDKGAYLNESSTVQAVVDMYGLSDLTKVGADYSEAVQETHKSAGATEALWVNGSPVFGGRDGGIFADPKAAEAANPISYIAGNKNHIPPFLLMHGDADRVVSPSQTDILFQDLKANGVNAERYIVPGAEHGGVYWEQETVQNVIVQFFDQYVKNSKGVTGK